MPEINDLIESYERRQKNKFKMSVIDDCRLGQIIAADISQSLSENGRVVKPWDIFPELFKKEQELYEQQYSEERFNDYKQQRKEYAAMMNAKRNMGKEV